MTYDSLVLPFFVVTEIVRPLQHLNKHPHSALVRPSVMAPRVRGIRAMYSFHWTLSTAFSSVILRRLAFTLPVDVLRISMHSRGQSQCGGPCVSARNTMDYVYRQDASMLAADRPAMSGGGNASKSLFMYSVSDP